jgi:homoserine kinase type II
MELTKTEAKTICKEYNLGEFKSLKHFSGGSINENYDLKTSKGNFVIKMLSINKETRIWLEKQLELEVKVLDFIIKNKFEYKVIEPLRNRKGRILSEINNQKLWLYRKIEGSVDKEITKEKTNEEIRCIAKYHRLISKFKHKEKKNDGSWFFKKYEEMKKVPINNSTDRLMIENLPEFEKILKAMLKIKFRGKEMVIIHRDFHFGNLLLDKGKIKGIIDFDNVEYAPKISDLAMIIRDNCINKEKFDMGKLKEIIKEYEKSNKLTKRERKRIYYSPLMFLCDKFWFNYLYYKNDLKKQKTKIEEIVKKKNIILKEFGGKIKWQE